MIINISENETYSHRGGCFMANDVNGYNDIYAILANERLVGGVIEAEKIILRSGEQYHNPVITNIDFCGSTFYTLSFVSEIGDRIIVNVSDVSMIVDPFHKRIHEMKNHIVKTQKLKEKNHYLKKLCSLNTNVYIKTFLDEVKLLMEDIGIENISDEIDGSFLIQKDKLFKIA